MSAISTSIYTCFESYTIHWLMDGVNDALFNDYAAPNVQHWHNLTLP